MKRRDFLKVGGVGLAASTIAAPAIAQSMPEVKWRLAASWPKSLDTLYGGCEYFCKRVAEVTDNHFQIQSFAAGEIVPAYRCSTRWRTDRRDGQYRALLLLGQEPGVHVRHGAAVRPQYTPAYLVAVVGRRPGHAQRPVERTHSMGIPTGSTGAQMGGWFRKEIKTIDDFKGLKFRVGGFAGNIIAKVGGVPQQIVAGDIYPALEKGTIDAAEWVGPYDDEKLGFVKVAKYYYYPGWWEGTGQGHNVINLDKWNALPKQYQAVVETASRDTFTWSPASTTTSTRRR